ncbi:ErpC protein [Borreliella carolinensis]|uniref:ErpC protein n=1 Tax=Borreliella carolinensis TaxID=478174 RepID=A0ACD5GLK5_9SPIR
MNKKTLIICAVFAMISSCKNYGIKDLEQKAKGQVNGFVDKILDPTKDKITSSGSIVDELAKKLQEEEKNELMQGDDPNGSGINPPPVLPENSHDNPPAPKVKAAEQNGDQKEEKSGKVEGKKEKQDDKVGKADAKKEVQENIKSNAKEIKVTAEQQKQEEDIKEKAEKEKKAKEEAKQKKQEEEKQRKEAEARAEKEKQRQLEEAEKKKVENKIKDLTDKIDKVNKDIDDINGKTIVKVEEVRDNITGPVYDDFTNADSSLYYAWNFNEKEESGLESELGKLLKDLMNDREKLRNKLNVGNESNTGVKKTPKLKETVNVSDIKGDLEKLRSKLEEVKKYLKNQSNFETIKEYITDSNDDYE